jgi:hypothetical protein
MQFAHQRDFLLHQDAETAGIRKAQIPLRETIGRWRKEAPKPSFGGRTPNFVTEPAGKDFLQTQDFTICFPMRPEKNCANWTDDPW